MAATSPPTTDDFFTALRRRLDRRGGEPLYLQIASLVKKGIESGDLPPGSPVPPQRQLSAAWEIGEVTIRRAFQALASEGLLDARAGSGTVVRDPSGAASDSASSRPLSIGVAFADLADGYPFMRQLLDGIRDTPRPVAVRAFDVPQGDLPMQTLASSLPLAGMDGLIAMSPVNLRLLALCQERRLPCVLLFSDIADGFTRCVVVDYARGVHQAVRHLVRVGSRRIALVTAGPERFSTGQWLDAHRDALELADLSLDDELVVQAGYDEGDGFRAARALLTRPQQPDAILFASDFLARGGLLAAHDLGLRVPDDVRIIGAGRVLGDEGWSTRLTTIDLRVDELGRIARRMIEAARQGEDAGGAYRASVPSQFMLGATA